MSEASWGTTLLTLGQVAERLGVHVKTARRYVREGRLKAVRIGKSYKISEADLAVLTGQSTVERDVLAGRCERHVEASTIVQIDAIAAADAQRVMNAVGGVIKGRDKQSDTPLCVDTIYDEPRGRLKLIITGSLATTQALLGLVAAHVE